MRINLFLECGQIALFDSPVDLRSLTSQIASWVMCLDAGTVLKRYVLCPHCVENYLFTLRAIAYNPELKCHGCGGISAVEALNCANLRFNLERETTEKT